MHKLKSNLYKNFGGANVSIIFLIAAVLVWQLPPNNPSNIFIKNFIFYNRNRFYCCAIYMASND